MTADTPDFRATTVAAPAAEPASAPAAAPRALSPAAARALAEAAERRAARDAAEAARAKEYHGRGGLDPVRYGDWEIKGLTADF